jgi:hypothetical protein
MQELYLFYFMINNIKKMSKEWAQPGIEPGTSSNSGEPEEGIILLDH